MDKKDLICLAIKNKQRIRFEYHGKPRKGEPQCCGITTAGNEGVRVNLIEGGSRPEQLFMLSDMKGLELIDEFFDKPGPNYKLNDSAMKPGSIFCQLEV
jgi:hypothetical protein